MEVVEIADILYNEIICRYGAPDSIVSDRGANFMSKVMKHICNIFQITKEATSSYYPETNAACERMKSLIQQTLRKYIDEKQDNWPKLLQSIMWSYRAKPCTESTQYSPYFLLFRK